MNLKELLKDYGYEYHDGIIVQKGIRGFCNDRIVGNARNIRDAAEWLCPIINDKDFTEAISR
jgi:hypothetical protein